MTFDARVRGESTDTYARPWRSRNENVSAALVLLQPRAVAELDERDERVEQRRGGRSSSIASLRLHEPRRVLEQHAAELPRRLERRERLAELARTPCSRSASSWPVISPLAFAWKTKPSGVRSAHFAAVSGRGQAVERRVDLDRVEALGVVGEPGGRRGDAPRVPALDQALVGPRARADPDQVRTTTLLVVPEKPASVAPTHGTGGWLAVHADAPRFRPGAAMCAVRRPA